MFTLKPHLISMHRSISTLFLKPACVIYELVFTSKILSVNKVSENDWRWPSTRILNRLARKSKHILINIV